MKHPKNYDTTDATRKRMSKVSLKGGKDEQLLAKALWQLGFRYRKNDKSLPGSPDIAILKYHLAVFIDGEFWHGYDWKNKKKRLKKNREYWIQKIEENIARDKRNDALLVKMGWQPVHFWSKVVLTHTEYCVSLIQYYVNNADMTE